MGSVSCLFKVSLRQAQLQLPCRSSLCLPENPPEDAEEKTLKQVYLQKQPAGRKAGLYSPDKRIFKV